MNPGTTLEKFLKNETEAGRITDWVTATIECLVTAGAELAASISFSPPAGSSAST